MKAKASAQCVLPGGPGKEPRHRAQEATEKSDQVALQSGNDRAVGESETDPSTHGEDDGMRVRQGNEQTKRDESECLAIGSKLGNVGDHIECEAHAELESWSSPNTGCYPR